MAEVEGVQGDTVERMEGVEGEGRGRAERGGVLGGRTRGAKGRGGGEGGGDAGRVEGERDVATGGLAPFTPLGLGVGRGASGHLHVGTCGGRHLGLRAASRGEYGHTPAGEYSRRSVGACRRRLTRRPPPRRRAATTLIYHLEDDTAQVHEQLAVNSGFESACFIRRGRLGVGLGLGCPTPTPQP